MESDAIEFIKELDKIQEERELTSYERGVLDALLWCFESCDKPIVKGVYEMDKIKGQDAK